MQRLSVAASLLTSAARRRAAAAAAGALADGATAAAAPPPSAWTLTPSRRWQATVHTLSGRQAVATPFHPLGWPRSASTLAPKRGRRRRDSESETPSSADTTTPRRRTSRSGRTAAAAPPLPPLPPPDAVPLARPPPRATDLPPGFPTSYAALSAAAEASPQTQGVTPDVIAGVDRDTMFAARDRMLAFTKAPSTRARALALYVNDALFNEAVVGFKRVLVRGVMRLRRPRWRHCRAQTRETTPCLPCLQTTA